MLRVLVKATACLRPLLVVVLAIPPLLLYYGERLRSYPKFQVKL